MTQNTKRLLTIINESTLGREIIRGIHEYSRYHGEWELRMEWDTDPRMVKGVRFAVHQWKADGIIATVRNRVIWRIIKNSRLPAVNTSGLIEFDMPTVKSDNQAVGKAIARHFLDCGHRNFAFSALTPDDFVVKRCEGFCRELSNAGFDCDVFTDECSGTREANWIRNLQRMDRWLLVLPKPVAIMCVYDLRGHEIASSCHHLGLRVPEDVSLAGCGNDDIMCPVCTPPLSSVDTDSKRIGYEAARLLDSLMGGKQSTAGPILIPPRGLVVRQSSDIINIDDCEIASAMRFIRNHANQPISVKDILREVPISRRAMERRFMKIIGRTPKAEIMRVHLERAQNLLAQTDMPIPAVAKASGFAWPKMFSGFFRRKTGLTPTAYRRNSRIGGKAPDIEASANSAST